MKVLLATLLILSCPLGWAGGNPTKFSQAVEYAKLGRFSEAQAIMADLVHAYPLNALYWFNLGQSFLNDGKYTKAIGAFRTVIGLKSPLSPAAQLYLSRAYSHTGKGTEARRELSALRKKNLPQNLVKEIELDWMVLENPKLAEPVKAYRERRYSEAIKGLQSESSASADYIRGMSHAALKDFEQAKISLDRMKGNSQSAVFSRDAEEILQRLDELENVPSREVGLSASIAPGYHSNIFGDGQSETKKARFVIVSGLGAEKKLLKNEYTEISAEYGLYWEEYPGFSNGRFLRNSLKVNFRYPFEVGDLILAPLAEWQLLADENFIYQAGLQSSFERKTGEWRYGLDTELRRNIPAHSVYDYINGINYSLGLFGEWRNLRMSYNFRGSTMRDLPLVSGDTLPLRYSAHGPALSYTGNFHKVSFGLAMSYFFQRFTNPSALTGKRRHDDTFSFQAVVQHPIEYNLNVQFRVGVVSNESNFRAGDPDDRDFNQFWFQAGVLWEIL